MFCIIKELLTQPVLWHILICAVYHNSGIVLKLCLFCVLICPVVFASRWVKTLELIRLISSSNCGLLNISDLFRSGELIQLLEPYDADVAKLWLNGFNFEWIVCSSEIDLLASRLVCDLEW